MRKIIKNNEDKILFLLLAILYIASLALGFYMWSCQCQVF